jgi:uncharacterized protein
MTKILLVAALIALVFFIWRWPRVRGGGTKPPTARPAPPAPQEMVTCPVCSVHLPQSEALPGPDGRHYCCQEHRRIASS